MANAQTSVFLLLSVLSAVSTTQTTEKTAPTLYFGIKTYIRNGVVLYVARETNTGEIQEKTRRSLAVENYLFGTKEDGNDAIILWKKPLMIETGYGQTGVAVSTIEFDPETNIVYCTFQDYEGLNRFGTIQYDQENRASILAMMGGTDHDFVTMANLRPKIGVSAFMSSSGRDGRFFFGTFESLVTGDSIWSVRPNSDADTYTLEKMPKIYKGMHELAEIIPHLAADVSHASIALDSISRNQEGQWQCSTLQYEDYRLYSNRKDEMFTRQNETAIIFNELMKSSRDGKLSMSINAGLSVFVYNSVKLTTLLRGGLQRPFVEPKSWAMSIPSLLYVTGINHTQFNQTLFKQSIVAMTEDVNDARDIKIIQIEEKVIVKNVSARRRLVLSYREINVTVLSINFTVTLHKITPKKTIIQLENLGTATSSETRKFNQFFMVDPAHEKAVLSEVTVVKEEVTKTVTVEEKLLYDKCVSEKPGYSPSIPADFFVSIQLNAQGSPFAYGTTTHPVMYDIFVDRASIAMEILSSKFDMSIYVVKEVPGETTTHVPECKCNNDNYEIDCSHGKIVTKAEIISSSRILRKEELVTEKIYCANVTSSMYGYHRPLIKGSSPIPQRGCEVTHSALLLTELDRSSTYTVFFVAHAGEQSTKPYHLTFQTQAGPPTKVELFVDSVTSDGFSIAADYKHNLHWPTRLLFLVIPRYSSVNPIVSNNVCDFLTPRQIYSIAKDNPVLTSLESCVATVVARGTVNIPDNGYVHHVINKHTILATGSPPLSKEGKFFVFLVAEHNWTVAGDHHSFSTRLKTYVHLAEHNITLSDTTLPENRSFKIDVYASLNVRPLRGELLHFSCYMRGHTSNARLLHVDTPGATENEKWVLSRHIIAVIFGVEDKNATEVPRKTFEVVCSNLLAPTYSKKTSLRTFHDVIESVASCETLNVIWPSWSDSFVQTQVYPKLFSRYVTASDSISLSGNETIKLGQFDSEWIGPSFMKGIRITIDGHTTTENSITDDGRILTFKVPTYERICVEADGVDRCQDDDGYQILNISNTWEIEGEGRLEKGKVYVYGGARGGSIAIPNAYYYRACDATDYSTDPKDCLDDELSPQKCAFGTGSKCIQCPPNTICPGGQRAWPLAGYWNKNDYSATIVPCRTPSIVRCTHHNHTGRFVQCGEGYKQSSLACDKCAEGYYPLWDRGCKMCKSYLLKSSAVPALAGALFYIFILLFSLALLTYASIIAVGGSIISSWTLSRRFTIEFVYLIQLISAAAYPRYPIQNTLMTAYSYVLSAFMLDWKGHIPLECYGNTYSPFTIDFLLMVTAISLTATCFLLAMFKKLRPEEWCRRKRTAYFWRNSVTPSFRFWNLSLLGVIYPATTMSILSVLSCVNIDGNSMLTRDLDLPCYTGEHSAMYALSWVSLIIYVIFFPIGVSYLLFKNFFGPNRHEFMASSKLKVYEFWMNSDFHSWRHLARLLHWFFLFLLCLSAVFLKNLTQRLGGVILDNVALLLYGIVVFFHSPKMGKLSLSDRVKDAFWIEKSAIKSRQEGEVPQEFVCPLSRKLMKDPVIASSGQNYEKKMLQKWLGAGNVIDPVNKRQLKDLRLKDNKTLRLRILAWKKLQSVRVKKRKEEESKSGWKSSTKVPPPITEEVYERELDALEETAKMIEKRQTTPELVVDIKLKFTLHIILRRTSKEGNLKSIRILLTSAQDPFFHMQEVCDEESFEMIREQYGLVSTFEDFPQLLGSMFDRSRDESDAFKLIISTAEEGLEFAQLEIRKMSLKGGATPVLSLNLIPSKYVAQIRWLYVGKMGAIILAMVASITSYMLYVTHEELHGESLRSLTNILENTTPVLLLFYCLVMLILHLIASNRFGKRMIIADENRNMVAGKDIVSDAGADEQSVDDAVQKELLIRTKLKNNRMILGANNTESLTTLGDLGVHLLTQKGREGEGHAYIREALKGLTKNKLLPTNPIFMHYQHALIAYAKGNQKQKEIPFKPPVNPERDRIRVAHFVSNKAELFGSWYAAHDKFTNKHKCGIVGQQIRALAVCVEFASVVVLTYDPSLSTLDSTILAKSIAMLITQLLLMVFIDNHVHLTTINLERKKIIICDICAAVLFFFASGASTIAKASGMSGALSEPMDSTDALESAQSAAPIDFTIISLQALNTIFMLILAFTLFLESTDRVWDHCVRRFKHQRRVKRIRRESIRRRSIQEHFGQPTFGGDRETKFENEMEMMENPMDTLKQADIYASRDRKHNRRSALDDYVRSGQKKKRELHGYKQGTHSTDIKKKASTESKPSADETPEERALRKAKSREQRSRRDARRSVALGVNDKTPADSRIDDTKRKSNKKAKKKKKRNSVKDMLDGMRKGE